VKLRDVEFSENREYVVIPRASGDIAFTIQPCDITKFDEIVPEPKAPVRVRAGGIKEDDLQNPSYVQAVKERNEKRVAFMVIEGLKATEGFEWETVKADNHDTWPLWQQEFRDAKFTTAEVAYIIRGVLRANSLDSEKIDEARDHFLQELAASKVRPAE